MSTSSGTRDIKGLTLARFPYFATIASAGELVRPPGDRLLMVDELREKKTVDAPRPDLAIAHIVFSPRSTFDLARSGLHYKVKFSRKK